MKHIIVTISMFYVFNFFIPKLSLKIILIKILNKLYEMLYFAKNIMDAILFESFTVKIFIQINYRNKSVLKKYIWERI